MELLEAIRKRRTIRCFDQEKSVDDSLIRELIDSARLAPSGGNMQQLRFIAVRQPEMVEKVFKLTAWASFVKPKRTPIWGHNAPTAFIAVIGPSKAPTHVHGDAGAAIQNILLRAVDLGLGCCWIGAFKPSCLEEVLSVPEDYSALYLVALGYPAEAPLQENITIADPNKYYLDDDNVLHVPKYTVDEITVWN